jgi:hypothetical protein
MRIMPFGRFHPAYGVTRITQIPAKVINLVIRSFLVMTNP